VAADSLGVPTNYGASQYFQTGPYGPASIQQPQQPPQVPGIPQYQNSTANLMQSYQNPQVATGLGMGPQSTTPGQLPLAAILAAMQPAGANVSQPSQPGNWLGPGTGGGSPMSLFGNVASAGGADPGNIQSQLALLSRLLGLGPSMSAGQGMNAFGGFGGTGGRLNTVASPLWGVGGGMERRREP